MDVIYTCITTLLILCIVFYVILHFLETREMELRWIEEDRRLALHLKQLDEEQRSRELYGYWDNSKWICGTKHPIPCPPGCGIYDHPLTFELDTLHDRRTTYKQYSDAKFSD